MKLKFSVEYGDINHLPPPPSKKKMAEEYLVINNFYIKRLSIIYLVIIYQMLGSKLNKIEFLSSGRLEAPNGDLLTSNHSMIIITIIKVGTKALYKYPENLCFSYAFQSLGEQSREGHAKQKGWLEQRCRGTEL